MGSSAVAEGRSVNTKEESDDEAPDDKAPATQKVQEHDLRDLVQVICLPQPVVKFRGLSVEPGEVGFILLSRLHMVVRSHNGLWHLR